MNGKKEFLSGPVPFEAHYTIFKCAEEKVNDHLAELDHKYYVVGLRVAYDLQDSSNEPGVLPYSVEFGNLEALENVVKSCEPGEFSEEKLHNAVKDSPMSFELMNQLYTYAKDELEAQASEKLNIGVFVVVYGSSEQGWYVGCQCGSGKHKKKKFCTYVTVNRRTKKRCWCTNIPC